MCMCVTCHRDGEDLTDLDHLFPLVYTGNFFTYMCITCCRAREDLQCLQASMEAGLAKTPQEQLSYAEPPDLADVAEEAEPSDEDVKKLRRELEELQGRFDAAVMEKHSLGLTCQQLAEQLKSALHLLSRSAGRGW